MTLLNASVHPITKPGTTRALEVGTFRRVLELAQEERERRRKPPTANPPKDKLK